MIPLPYEGFSISEDATQVKTPEGVFSLIPGKNFYFVNPNTGTKTFAKPNELLERAKRFVETGGVLPPKKVPAKKSAPKKKVQKVKVPTPAQLERARLKKEREDKKKAKEAEKVAKAHKREMRKKAAEEKKIKVAKRKHQLLPDFVADRFREQLANRRKRESGENPKAHVWNGLFIDYEKTNRVTELVANAALGVSVIHIVGPQNWRDGYFFYNPITEKYTKFIFEIHKPGIGNDKIIWPTDLGGEHLLGAKHQELRLKKEMARLTTKRTAAPSENPEDSVKNVSKRKIAKLHETLGVSQQEENEDE